MLQKIPRVVNGRKNIHDDGSGMTRTSTLAVKAVSVDKLGLQRDGLTIRYLFSTLRFPSQMYRKVSVKNWDTAKFGPECYQGI